MNFKKISLFLLISFSATLLAGCEMGQFGSNTEAPTKEEIIRDVNINPSWGKKSEKFTGGKCENSDGCMYLFYEDENGIRQGPSKTWYNNGVLNSYANIKDGGRDGLIAYWHKNGQLKSLATFRDSKIIELWKERNEDGELISEGKEHSRSTTFKCGHD